MIINSLLALANTLLGWFLALRPAWQPSLPPSVSQFVGFCESWDGIFPVNETLACISTLCLGAVVFVGVKWGKTLVDWITNVIP